MSVEDWDWLRPRPPQPFVIHPASLTALVLSGMLPPDRKGSKVRRSGWKCQVCGDVGHIGDCDPDVLARADAAVSDWLKSL